MTEAAEVLYDTLAGIVPAIARRVHRRCPPAIALEDLEQVGRAALWQVCQAFDPARAVTFPTYARMRICGAILDAIRGPEYREAARERDAIRLDSGHNNAIVMPFPRSQNASRICDPFIARAVRELSGRRAAVMGLRFYAGLSRAETGARLGISGHTVGMHERAAVRKLRALLLPRAA